MMCEPVATAVKVWTSIHRSVLLQTKSPVCFEVAEACRLAKLLISCKARAGARNAGNRENKE